MRRIPYLLALTVGFLLALTPAARANHVTPGNVGDLLLSCAFDHAASDDPIVFPGQPGAAHRHAFLGAVGIDAFSTFSSLTAATSTCGIPGDKAGYWMPTITAADGITSVNPTNVQTYYRRLTSDRVFPFPMGLKHVQGNPSNTSTATYSMTYGCGTNSGQTTIPASCPAGQGMTANIYFSQCWDGKNIDNATHKTLGTCGPDFPVRVPAIVMQFFFPASAIGGKLSSDTLGAPRGTSGHADFWNTWDPTVMQQMTDLCLNAGLHCRVQGGAVKDVGVNPPVTVFTL